MEKMASKRSQHRDSWETLQKEDPIEAMIALQKHLETFSVVRRYKWEDFMYSKLPTSLLPKTVKNAEIINAVLAKSWEVQGSRCPEILGSEPLMSMNCMRIHTYLMYYFKTMNVADNMERIVGSISGGKAGAIVHSFLKIGNHIVDNTFDESNMKNWNNIPKEMFKACLASKYNDGDPADPKFGVLRHSSEIGLENERLLFGNDDKSEQMSLLIAADAQNVSFDKTLMYDTEMRKFIKEEYGIEIENLAKKWSRLCWNCFAEVEDLKKCTKCRTARYCGKDCQVQDWKKVHKIAHEKYATHF